MSGRQTQVQIIKDRMKELEFFPKKFLGQHFLINPQTIQRIISEVKSLKSSLIMEVGPGLGALTDELILLKQPLYVVEKDSTLCRYWKEKNVCVLEGDVLKLNWESQLLPHSILVGNLPYQVASRLMVKCCPGSDKLKAMVLMFQKEVAKRILAKPGSKDYGILSVLSQCFWVVNSIAEASVSDFYPRPQVAGQVLVFHKKKMPLRNTDGFLSFVKLCFSQRRKFLLNRLKKMEKGENIVDLFNQINIPSSVRAEELSPQHFISLFNGINCSEYKKLC